MSLEKLNKMFEQIEQNNEIIKECDENIEAIEKLHNKIVESDGE